MQCRDVMTRDPVVGLPTDTVERAAQLMKSQDVGPLPVVEEKTTKKLVGIVTDRDLAVRVVAEGRDPLTTRVEEVMSRQLVTCREEDDVERAVELMEQHQVRRLPVVDENGSLIGIIAQADIATRAAEAQKTAELVEEISEPKKAVTRRKSARTTAKKEPTGAKRRTTPARKRSR